MEEELGVSEVAGVVLPGLPVASDESFLEVSGVPDPLLHLLALEEVFSLLDKLIGSHLDVLVEKVASQHLLPVLGVQHLGVQESVPEHCLSHELEVLVMEEHVVVVKEQERHERKVHHVLLEERVINVQISHVIIPLWIVRVQQHRLKWEFRANSLDHIEQVQHLLDRFVSLLPHTSAFQYQLSNEINDTYLWTGRLPSSTPSKAMVVKYLSILLINYNYKP